MNKILLSIMMAIAVISCTPVTPEQLAKDSCECFQNAKAKQNSDAQIQAIDNCTGLVQNNLERLRRIEKDKDMNDEASKAFEKRFDDAYNKCK